MTDLEDGDNWHTRLAHWDAFLASVEAANAFVAPGALRRYQADFLDRGEVIVASPYSGEPIASRSDAIGPPGHSTYFFPGKPHFWLLTPQGQFLRGQPLWYAIFEGDGQLRRLFGPKRPDVPIPTDRLKTLLKTSNERQGTQAKPATLVIGHPNFAHHLWNELSALDVWLDTASSDAIASVPIIAVAEPLGPIREIFPKLSSASICAPGESKRNVPLKVRIGSCLVTSRIRERLRDYSIEHGTTSAVQKIIQHLSRGWPRIWVSLRQDSRTPDNQLEFLLATLREIFRAYPSAVMVLDGFSFPARFFEDPRAVKFHGDFTKRSAAASDLIRQFHEKVAREIGPQYSARMQSISGLSLLEAISAGSRCEYYVCHAGTLQHKIGWFHDTPGFVHTAPSDYKYAVWCTSQVEGGTIPDFLPAVLTEPTDPPRHRQDIARNYNYRITDIEKAVEAVLLSMRSRLTAACLQ